MKLVGQVILRIIIYYIISILFYIVVLDGVLGNFLGNSLYRINYDLYYWCVTSKETIFIVYLITVFINTNDTEKLILQVMNLPNQFYQESAYLRMV